MVRGCIKQTGISEKREFEASSACTNSASRLRLLLLIVTVNNLV